MAEEEEDSFVCRLVDVSKDEDGSDLITLSPLSSGGPAAQELASRISTDGVPWGEIMAESTVLALKLEILASSGDKDTVKVQVVQKDEEEGDDDDDGHDDDEEEDPKENPHQKQGGHNGGGGGGGGGASKRRRLAAKDDGYFEAYDDISVHELMLRDGPRMEAYRNSIFSQKSLFEGKAVLDVGTGTGVLAMWCAQAGARKVYAVEGSGMAAVASRLVEANGLSGVVEVISQAPFSRSAPCSIPNHRSFRASRPHLSPHLLHPLSSVSRAWSPPNLESRLHVTGLDLSTSNPVHGTMDPGPWTMIHRRQQRPRLIMR
jgi:hypothetical protein